MRTNEYSPSWFGVFADTIAPEQTRREVRFLMRHLPLPRFHHILDVGCGTGRHAGELLEQGYKATCIDVSEHALETARARLGDRALVMHHDMRRLQALGQPFDAVLMLWQGFGHFDDATNQDCLRQVNGVLSPGGRFVLDIYHRAFFETRLGERRHDRGGVIVVERKSMHDNRLRVELEYGDGRSDTYEWQLYTPQDIVARAASVGFTCLIQCTEFDESIPPSAVRPRAQFVFERAAPPAASGT